MELFPQLQSSPLECLLPVKVEVSRDLVLKEMLVRIGVMVQRQSASLSSSFSSGKKKEDSLLRAPALMPGMDGLSMEVL